MSYGRVLESEAQLADGIGRIEHANAVATLPSMKAGIRRGPTETLGVDS